ncbi:hypothetical protein G0Q06_06950 [Puniceicoccales bacterium CK1056]|uniref:Uncharacterized protein n=1 Tax=Oceanipulchritudo coccoides TaxID=2706888 RepID=A0A6B2M3A5_9BACT|nr:hypothetical protein [Oceanipulchritudo coccoides]NDV62180.1 hypothetical protein [Oceanipulchritudo coccoides]
MSGFDENIVREYFELHGFLVRQVRKYQVQARRKVAEEEIDLLVYNPTFAPGDRDPNFLLFASELPYLHRAVVVVKAWHTTHRFTPNLLKSSSEILKFLGKNVSKAIEGSFKETDTTFEKATDLKRILVLPGLPTSEPYRSESIQLLREQGVDGIISFRTMLLDIIEKIEVNRSYQKSEFLQILRVLKNYDLLKDSQMGLFKD